MALKVTEQWVKDRIKLDHDKMEDVKSIVLPGSYHEKIGSLSTALSNFSRLQHVDVSRNSISSLDGLSHLKHLESLNLYYNQIPDLREVFKLRKNQNLLELDLRLNPVTKTEPDYRLFVVHMLPALKRLDDRPVRDSERKAALMHFCEDQAREMSAKSPERQEKHERESCDKYTSSQPRAEYVKKMMKKHSVDEESDSDVIDIMNRNHGEPRNTLATSGGGAKHPEAHAHTHEELVRLTRQETNERRRSFTRQETNERRRPRSYETTDPCLNSIVMEIQARTENDLAGQSSSATSLVSKKSGPVRNEVRVGRSYDYNEDDAYTKYKSVANFTRHPGSEALPPTVVQRSHDVTEKVLNREMVNNGSMTPDSYKDEYQNLPKVKHLDFEDSGMMTQTEERPLSRSSFQSCFIEEFLDAVDRYWNGSKSLHYNKKFQNLIEKPLSKFEAGLTRAKEIQLRVLQEKLNTMEADNKALHVKMHTISKQAKSTDVNHDTYKDMDALRSRLQLSTSDNKILRNKIAELEDKIRRREDDKISHNSDYVSELEHQKHSLIQQVANLKLQLKNYESIDELTKMLQDSHKSLIKTNDRLLSEIDETRSRHQSEVEQLKWSYDQLRKTSQMVGSTMTTNGLSSFANGY